MKRRIISFIIIFTLIITMMPASAYASSGDEVKAETKITRNAEANSGESQDNPKKEDWNAAETGKGWYQVGDEEPRLYLNSENFPDENFRKYLNGRYPKNYIGGAAELKNLTSINTGARGIKSIKGVEYFTSLKVLDCSSNEITELDLSKNKKLEKIYCRNNKLTSLKLPENTLLGVLDCSNNQLTSLTLPENNSLKNLDCSNNQLPSLDVSGNTGLQELDCSNNQLTALDVKKNVNLLELRYNDNNFTKPVNLEHNKKLKFVDYSGHKFGRIVDANPNIIGIYCRDNDLKDVVDFKSYGVVRRIDISNNKGVTNINAKSNALEELKINNCDIDNNNFENWKLGEYEKLYDLYCEGNNLAGKLDLSNLNSLFKLYCSNNQLTNVEVRPGMWVIDVSNNRLGEIKNREIQADKIETLQVLNCSNNQLKGEPDLSGFKKLEVFDCSDNQFKGVLDFSENNKAIRIDCSSNQFTKVDCGSSPVEELYCSNNPTLKEVSITNLKKLKTLNIEGNSVLTDITLGNVTWSPSYIVHSDTFKLPKNSLAENLSITEGDGTKDPETNTIKFNSDNEISASYKVTEDYSFDFKITRHKLSKVEKQDPTFTSNGRNEYWFCNTCNKKFLDEEGTQETRDENLVIQKLTQLPDEPEKPETGINIGMT